MTRAFLQSLEQRLSTKGVRLTLARDCKSLLYLKMGSTPATSITREKPAARGLFSCGANAAAARAVDQVFHAG